MKRIASILLVLCLALHGKAQTWNEWFRQKETQINYLVEQIAALKMYCSTVQQGYDLVNQGLRSISHFKGEDLRLHQEYFASLLTIKSTVKENRMVRHIASLQAYILNLNRECKQTLSIETEFSSLEKEYFENVFRSVLKECKAIGNEVVSLTTDDHYQMSDEERLKRLQALNSSMEGLYIFSRQFRSEITTTAYNRKKENKEITKLRSLY